MAVDVQRNRISLTMKKPADPKPHSRADSPEV